MPPLARWHLGSLLPLQSITRVRRRIWDGHQEDGSEAGEASHEGEGLLGNGDGSESPWVGEGESVGR